MARPLGITVLGILVLLASAIVVLIGVAGFFVGLAFLLPGTPISGTTLILYGLLYIVIGVVLGIAGAGLLGLRPWAWWLALLATVAYLAYLGYGVYQDTRGGGSVSLTSVITLVIVGVILIYIVTVYRAFHPPAAPVM